MSSREAAPQLTSRAARALPAAPLFHLTRSSRRRAHGSKRCPQLPGEELRLLPGGEVAAPVDRVEVGKAGVDRLDPAARRSPDLAGERREADRNLDRRRSLAASTREKLSELPVPPGGRGAGLRQPVQRDVVDDALPGEIAHGLSVDECPGNLVVTVRVMVEQPGREPDG